MLPEYAHSSGGKIMAPIIRKKWLDKYYENPNHCLQCGHIIEVKENEKPSTTKLKKFCNSSCAAKYNNSKKPKKIKKERKLKRKKREKSFSFLLGKTKKEIFNSHSNWQSARTSIRRHAVSVYNNSDKPKCCEKCGYDKHYEVCHIKAVSDFSDDSRIEDINNINNLKALCPNHHWEFDNGILWDSVTGNTQGS